MSTKPKTAGTYVEIDLDHVGEGDFKQQFEKELRNLYAQYARYLAENGDPKAKAKLTCTVDLSPMGDEYMAIEYSFQTKLPAQKQQAFARGAGGRLLVNPEGDSLHDNDQPWLYTFDRHGNAKAPIDPNTGEVIEQEDESVAGRVGGSDANGSA